MRRPEILAPAGDFVCLQAALDAGADAVYFGLGTFNMRARSGVNFKEEDLPEISRRCKEHGAKAYLALNAIMFEGEMADVEKVILAAKAYVDAVIVADWGVVGLCVKHSIPFHVSTQMSTSNSQAALFLASQGAERVVLARECSLSEVKKIHSVLEGKIELECFVHGAQCVAESGRCFMSHDIFGKSANRGECHQPCRRRFLVKAVDLYEDELGNPVHDSDTAFEVGPHTVMSAKDLCSLSFVDKLMDAGIASFKIEGRARNAEYVKTVTAAYREAVDAVIEGRYTPELIASLEESVDRVFHREFSKGLYFGRPGEDQFTDCQSSRSSYIKRHVGIVEDYFVKAGIVQVTIQDHSITEGDLIQIHGPTTGVVELTVPELRRDNERPTVAERGTWITFAAPRCRVGDKVFFMEKRNTLKSLAVALLSFILPISLLASIAVNIDTPIKDQRDSRAGTGVGYSGSMGQERHCFTKQFFVNEPDKSWEILRAGGYWFDRSYNTSQHWQRSIRLDYVKDPVERAKLEKKVVHPRYFYDWCKKHGVRSLNVLECTSSITNYVTGATSSALNDVKKGILDYVKWIVDNGYKDQIVGFELGNEPYFGSNPEESAARWSVIVPEIKKIFPEVDIGISVAEYREGDPDIAAVRRRSTAVDKWFEGGDYYGFNRVNQWSGRFIVSSSNFMHHISHVIYHFYGGNSADGLGPCGYRRIRHFAKAFPEVANKRVWVTEWRERSDEDCRCHQMFSSTLTKAHYILSSTAAKMFDCSSLHTASSLSGGFAITSGDGVWHVQWDPAGRNFSDPDFTGKPRMEVGPAGPLFRLYNEALQGHPLICAFGGRGGIRNPEEDWTGVMFYNNTKKYEAWHRRNEEGPPPKSGGGPTWVAAASPDRTSLNLLVCNSSDEPWTQEFVFPGYKIVGAKKVRAYSCKTEYVQRHMIPGEKSLAWEEEYEVTDKSIKIKPYTIATINFKIKKAKAVVGLLSDTFITPRSDRVFL
jgi:putative protease